MKWLLMLWIFQAVSHSVCDQISNNDWLQQPGPIHVCEGDTAHFNWNYNNSLGTFSSLIFLKHFPNWMIICEKCGTEPLMNHFSRARLEPDTTYYFQLRDTVPADSGNYELQVNLENPKLHLYDKADVNVISKRGCPNKLKYQVPELLLIQQPSPHTIGHVKHQDIIKLNTSTILTIFVNVPGGDPSVQCEILKDDTRVLNCSGIKEKDTYCEVTMELVSLGTFEFVINFNYIAYESTTTEFFVQVTDYPPYTTSFKSSDAHVFIIWIGIALLAVFILVGVSVVINVWRLRRRSDMPKGDTNLEMKPFVSHEDCIKTIGTKNKQRAIDEHEEQICENEKISPPIKHKNVNTETPLHNAALCGRLVDVKELCDHGGDLSALNEFRCSPLGSACRNGHLDVVEYLIKQGADIDFPEHKGCPPLHIASKHGQVEIVKYLCNNGASLHILDEKGKSALGWAASLGKCGIMKLLLENGSDIDFPGNEGIPPLHCAALRGQLDAVQLLCDNGAKFTEDKIGNTPLGSACWNGQFDAVKYFIERGMNINAPGSVSNPPIHCAAYRGHLPVVQLLLDKGADLQLCDKYGRTALANASIKGHLDIVKLLLDKGADVNHPKSKGEPPVHCAASGGHLQVVKYLLMKKADVSIVDDSGMTPLSSAAHNGHIKVISFLLEQGADVNYPQQAGQPPLHSAAENDQLDAVMYLVQNGADPTVANEEAKIPINLAAGEGHLAIVQYLNQLKSIV